MSPRTGRPPKDNSMNERIQFRLSIDYMKKLDECAKEQNTTRSEIIRQGIDLVYEKTKK
ncbi:MAG: CopG family transcriptional regulator [Oscillospiraceae bacterium]|nr:CopG family transcriptional regulator [Oscillospiraceae bacterium]